MDASSPDELLHQALHDPSFWRSRAAVRALEQLPAASERMLPALTAALSQSEARTARRAVRLLASLGGSSVVPALREALRHSAWQVRRAAALALIGGREIASKVLPDLIATLSDAVSGVREAAAEVVAELTTGEIAPELLQLLADSDRDVRVSAVRALTRLGVRPALVPGFCAALRDESSTARWIAASALGSMPPGTTVVEQALLETLDDHNRTVKGAAITALGGCGAEEAVRALLPLLSEEEARTDTARALGRLGARMPHVEPLLLEVLRGGATPSRVGAAQALGLLGSSPALERLRQLARRGGLSARRRAIRSLGWFGGRAADILPDLDTLLRDSHWRVRRSAAEALGQLGPRAAPILAGLLKRRYDHEPRVRAACAAALEQVSAGLSVEDRDRLGILADSSHGATHNLRRALNRFDLPASTRADFTAACVRRTAWHAGHVGASPPLGVATDPWKAARAAARQAAHKAVRKVVDVENLQIVARSARVTEHAWQIALLWTLLHRDEPETTSLP